MFYTLLDISSKVGFGLLSINTLRKLEKILPASELEGDYLELPREGISTEAYR
jgi:hypothetical protein